MGAEAAIVRLRATMADAEAVIAAGGRYMTIVSTSRAMRALGLRGQVLCENADGSKAYSVLAHRVIERVNMALAELE